MHHIALFGGTFNPIHLGHIKAAQCIQAAFHFEHFYFLPCQQPVHKALPNLSATDRIQLIKLALQDMPVLNGEIALEEINHDGPSYMVDTLTRCRAQHQKPVSITLILGRDSFLTLPTWHQWTQLLSLCHLLVIERPGTPIECPAPLQSLIQHHETQDKQALLEKTSGLIYFFNAGAFEVSSTMIQQRLAAGQSIENLVSKSVAAYLSRRLSS